MLLFSDSFDHYTTLTQKGWVLTGNTGITAAAGRWRDGAWVRTTSVSGTGGTIATLFSSLAEVIVGGAINPDARVNFRWDFREGATVHISVTLNTTSGLVEVRRGAGGTLLATGSIAIPAAAWTYLEVSVKVSNTVGTVFTQVDGIPDISLTGADTQNGGTGVMDRFVHVIPYRGATVASSYSYLDDFVVLDTSGSVNNAFLGDTRVEAILPDGNGNSSELVGSDGNSVDNYLLVREVPPDGDVTYVESSTPGDEDTYAYSPVLSTSGAVHGVQVCLYARKTDANPRSIAARQRLAGVEVAGSNLTLPAAYAYLLQIFEDDPSSNQWTIANIDVAEFGVEVTA
jgi:hypothetical protein